MPCYQFKCDTCKTINEFKFSMNEHTLIKNNIHCETCNNKMVQVVAPLRFNLKGEGWFGNGYGGADSNEHPYCITQRELDKNKDTEKLIEDIANNYRGDEE